MYRLVTITDVVQIHPKDFTKSSARAVEDYINEKYADKVIHRAGLCVGFHSIIRMSEGLISHGSGIVNVNVDFRVIVFRPFKGEIVSATITDSADGQGIALSHDFFEDVVVPPETLFEGTKWSQDESGMQLYIWEQEIEGEEQPNQYFFDRAESCLYRVEEEQWHDMTPQRQDPPDAFSHPEESEGRKVPYLIRGSMMLSGLGPTLWWTGDEQSGEHGDMEEDIESGAQQTV